MAKPNKLSKERDIFNEIELKVMLINEQIENHQKSIATIKKMSGWRGPVEVSGIDNTKEQEKMFHNSFGEGLRMIQRDAEQIARLKTELSKLYQSKKRIKKIYETLGGNEEQVYYWRIIRKLTQEETADKMGFSKRHIQRIEASMRNQGLL